MRIIKLNFLLAAVVAIHVTGAFAQKSKQGSVVTKHIMSSILRNTRTGLDSNRLVKIYLPPGYTASGKSYPVVYYFHNVFSSAENTLADGNVVKLIEKGFEKGAVQEFILVVADYSSPTTGSLYENSTATGRWLDFTIMELVPFIDNNFHTLRDRRSRALVGEVMGARGALVLAMKYPDYFNVVYAMNPVGTGLGLLPIETYPKWQKMIEAKSFADLQGEHISQLFVTMSQAFFPNPNRPPFYCDFLMEMENGTLTYNAANAQKLMDSFFLTKLLESDAAQLKKVSAIAMDWARYDPVQDHVYGSQAFSRKLDFFGIEHEAEEYRGNYWSENWAEHGRFYARVLSFLNQHLSFNSTLTLH